MSEAAKNEAEAGRTRGRLQAVMAVGQLSPSDMGTHVPTLVAALADVDSNVRLAANAPCLACHLLTTTPFAHHNAVSLRCASRRMPPALPAICSPQRLVSQVRLAAMRVLGQLELAMLMALGAAVASSLSDSDPDVRMAGLRVLARLDASQLAKHANAIVERLADPDSDVRGSPRMAP